MRPVSPASPVFRISRGTVHDDIVNLKHHGDGGGFETPVANVGVMGVVMILIKGVRARPHLFQPRLIELHERCLPRGGVQIRIERLYQGLVCLGPNEGCHG